MLFGVFITLGVAVLSVGLRSFQNSYAQKVGAPGILAATFLAVLQRRGSSPGRDLPERTTRFFVLLSTYFVARQRRQGLDHMELSVVLRLETHAALPHQSTAAGSIVLAALSKSSRVSSPEQS